MKQYRVVLLKQRPNWNALYFCHSCMQGYDWSYVTNSNAFGKIRLHFVNFRKSHSLLCEEFWN